MYKNMKIEINEQQPIDDVVMELERLGYKCFSIDKYLCNFVITNTFGWFDLTRYDSLKQLTTLAELRSMNIVQLKEM